MNDLNSILLEEISGFKKLGHKFLNNEISSMDFKKFSGGMGVYAHRGGKEFMARLRIPSGVVTNENFKVVYKFAAKYKLDGIHLTTRQSLQLHGLSIDQICEVMEEGLKDNIYTRGTGGNYPRNVAMSPLSGVDPNEAFDVTPYAMKVNQYIIDKIYTYNLPRKMKVSFSSSEADDAHCTSTDIGFLAVKNDNKEYFRLFLGGGIGSNPELSIEFEELIETKDILYHLEAITNLFISEGDYDNKGKARIRYIVKRMGKVAFIECYKKHLKIEKLKNNLDVIIRNKEVNKVGVQAEFKHTRLFSQKQKGLYSIYFHPIGGKLTLDTMKLITKELDNTIDGEIRLTMTEGLYIRNLDGKEAKTWLELTDCLGGETRLEQSISCIGVPICQIGVLNSQSTLEEVIKLFRANNFKKDVLPIIRISGCRNSCTLHEVGAIGLMGKIKKIEGMPRNIFELQVDGNYEIGKTRFGKNYGDLPQEIIPKFLYELALLIDNSNDTFSKWLDKNEDKFKNLVGEYSV